MMGNLSKEGAGKNFLYTSDKLLRMVLGFIPGAHIVEGLIDFKSGLRQNRLIDFSEDLKNILEQYAGRELQAGDFNNEDFVDVLESVLSKIQVTKSKYKRERFRNILFNQIIEPIDSDTTLIYVRILSEINDLELIILDEMLKKYPDGSLLPTFRNGIFGAEEPSSGQRCISINGEVTTITNHEMEFFINHLISIGLLFKYTETSESIMPLLSSTSGRGEKKTHKPVMREYISMSGVGKDFVNFIKEPE